MDITIYLPDELGKWAKEHELGLSRMLRDAVEAEKRRLEAGATLKAKAETYLMSVAEPDDHGGTDYYTARLHGRRIGAGCLGGGDVYVYVGENGKLYVHSTADDSLVRDVATGELRKYVDETAYVEAMRALGEEVTIDIGLPEDEEGGQ